MPIWACVKLRRFACTAALSCSTSMRRSRNVRAPMPVVASLLCLAACGADPSAQPSTAPPTTDVAPIYRPPPPCRTAADCLDQATAALGADPAGARALFALACEKRSPSGCLGLGKLLAQGRGGPADLEGARITLERVCRTPSSEYRRADCAATVITDISSTTCLIDGCAWLANVTPTDAAEQTAYAARACSVEASADPADVAMRARACVTLAKYHEGAGQPVDARRAYDAACALGSNDACRISLATPRPPGDPTAASSGSGATIEMPSITTDGLLLEDVSCELADSGVAGLLFGATVAAGFAPHLPTLERCTPGPYEAKLQWTADGHRVVELTAQSSDAKTAACVEKTLRGAFSALTGTCRAVLVVGRGP
jgi:hypothetical protein